VGATNTVDRPNDVLDQVLEIIGATIGEYTFRQRPNSLKLFAETLLETLAEAVPLASTNPKVGQDAPFPDFLVVTMRHDYGTLYWSMEDGMPTRHKKAIQEVAISEFKAKCLSLLDEVSKTRTPLRVTRRGKAIADVIPASSEAEERSWIGSMSDSIEIVGDIVSPVIDTATIEALKN
jgi:prevent-host-death family protein